VNQLRAIVEIAFFAVGIYIVLRFLRQTRGSGVIRGLTIILIAAALFYAVAGEIKLERIRIVFDYVAPITVTGLIIVFQPEIRRAIVQLGDSPIFGRLIRPEVKVVPRVLRAVARLQQERTGALIVLEREASLEPFVEKGVRLDAEVNSFLLESIFHPGNALHDGAAIVRDDRIAAASCILPLTDNTELSKRLGTRHRAAVGLAEETDALSIVISEETGSVSAALNGQLHYDLTLEQLEQTITKALSGKSGSQ
jgi:diadenylate cyclase